jgi:hypothetical protein
MRPRHIRGSLISADIRHAMRISVLAVRQVLAQVELAGAQLEHQCYFDALQSTDDALRLLKARPPQPSDEDVIKQALLLRARVHAWRRENKARKRGRERKRNKLDRFGAGH